MKKIKISKTQMCRLLREQGYEVQPRRTERIRTPMWDTMVFYHGDKRCEASLIPIGTPYTAAVLHVRERQIRPEYREREVRYQIGRQTLEKLGIRKEL